MRLTCVFVAIGVLFAGLWATPFRADAQQNQTSTEDARPDGKGDRTRQMAPRTNKALTNQNQNGDTRPDGKGDRTRRVPPRAGKAAAPATGNGINYHGGPLILGTTNVYYIWYGNWSNSPAVGILTNLAQHMGGSPYFNINTTYSNAAGTAVSNSVAFGGSASDNYSRGTSLSDNDIATIVTSAISTGGLPKDQNGVYFVLTSPDVQETSGFCTIYCGWHTNGTILGSDIKYSFVGDADQCPSACAAQSPGPNSTTGPDAMASIVAHELEEAVTDPDLNAWYDSAGNENADKCAWTFGSLFTAPNGAAANMTLGTLDYLIQQNWVNASGGYCALSFASVTPDFTVSVAPSSQRVAPGGSTQPYTVTITPSHGFAGTVNLSASGLPAGATAAFSPSAATTTSSLTVSTTSAIAAGSYAFTITGTNGSLRHSTTATLVVTAAGDFSVAVTPTSQTVHHGSAVTYKVQVTASGGFNSSVSFSVSGLPSRTSGSFSPSSVNGSGTSKLTVSTRSRTRTGTFHLVITGTGGNRTHTAAATLVVN
jgi:Phosphate-induced protein 1 conserved region